MTSEPQATVGSVMHPGVVTCSPDVTLRTVAAILAAHRIHAVVVASPEEAVPCAVVTDRDVVFSYSQGTLDRLTARDAASEPTVTVREGLDLRYASEAMVRHGTTHVIVTAPGDGRPVGILSSLDIANAVAG